MCFFAGFVKGVLEVFSNFRSLGRWRSLEFAGCTLPHADARVHKRGVKLGADALIVAGNALEPPQAFGELPQPGMGGGEEQL